MPHLLVPRALDWWVYTCSLGRTWQYLETMAVVTTGAVALGTHRVAARDAI